MLFQVAHQHFAEVFARAQEIVFVASIGFRVDRSLSRYQKTIGNSGEGGD